MDNNYISKRIEFKERIDGLNSPKDVLDIQCGVESFLKVVPNSATYEIAFTKLGKPFYIQLNDYDLSESVGVDLTLEQAIELRDFFDSKIKLLEKI